MIKPIVKNKSVIGYKTVMCNECSFHSFGICNRYKDKIVIPKGVKIIDDYAFEYCSSLVSVEIPDSVTEIGYRAFQDCYHLENITIPKSVTDIDRCAFSGCVGFVVHCHKDSFAEEYCIANGIDYEVMDNMRKDDRE